MPPVNHSAQANTSSQQHPTAIHDLAILAYDAAVDEQRREPITEERVTRELQRRGHPTDTISIDCAISDQSLLRDWGWIDW